MILSISFQLTIEVVELVISIQKPYYELEGNSTRATSACHLKYKLSPP
jgi:hypothetical protein